MNRSKILKNNNEKFNIRKRTLYKSVFIYFVLFSLGILLAIFLMQAIFLKPMYKNFKKNELKLITDSIEKNLLENELNLFDDNKLDSMAYNNQVQIYIYQNNSIIYTSDTGSGRVPQNINNEINSIIKHLDEAENRFEYEKDTNFKKFNTKVNIFAKKININNSEKKNDFKIVLISPLEQMESTVEVLIIQTMYISVFTVLIAIIVSIILSRNISRPIEKITVEASLLEKGRYDLDIPETKYFETENLRNALITSSKKLKERDEFQKNIIANVSHDLKTPLTVIKAYAEKINDISGDDKAKRKKDLDVIIKETDSLSLLISDILDLSKLDKGDYILSIEDFKILEVLESIIDRLKPIILKKQINIVITNKEEYEDIVVKGDKLKIGQVIYNLLTNAINYSPIKSVVNINFLLEKDYLKFEVQDFGKGISKKDLKGIFGQGYKSNDKTRKEEVPSSGLGLSIVKSILDKHGYKYGVESEEGKGSTFWFNIKT